MIRSVRVLKIAKVDFYSVQYPLRLGTQIQTENKTFQSLDELKRFFKLFPRNEKIELEYSVDGVQKSFSGTVLDLLKLRN